MLLIVKSRCRVQNTNDNSYSFWNTIIKTPTHLVYLFKWDGLCCCGQGSTNLEQNNRLFDAKGQTYDDKHNMITNHTKIPQLTCGARRLIQCGGITLLNKLKRWLEYFHHFVDRASFHAYSSRHFCCRASLVWLWPRNMWELWKKRCGSYLLWLSHPTIGILATSGLESSLNCECSC